MAIKIKVKAQVFKRVYRPTGESPQTYPFISLWSPFLPGSYLVHATGKDLSDNIVSSQSRIVTVTTVTASHPQLKAPNSVTKFNNDIPISDGR